MANLRPTGRCKLCGLERDLCDSHYLPKGMYKSVRAKELKNPNPVMSVSGELTQVSDQYRGYVLCEQCEGLFNERGEKWVVANSPRCVTAPFPMQDALRSLNPIRTEDSLEVYDISQTKAFNIQKLVYFGMSIFWRGSACQWRMPSTGQESAEVDLGAYEEPIRRFLLGEIPFPTGVSLKLDIWPFSQVLQALYPVVAEQMPEGPRYWFYVPGLLFFLFVGNKIPEYARLLNLNNGVTAFDVGVACSVYDYIIGGAKSQKSGSKMAEMVQEIRKIRPALNK